MRSPAWRDTGLGAAVAFLTPFGGAVDARPGALGWFPVVGGALGLGVGVIWWGTWQWWPPAVAASLAVVTDLACTGLLHVDGLADAADGLLAPIARARRLEVMADPGIGAFALAVTTVTVLVRVAALTAIRPSPLLIASLWMASRTWMSIVIVAVPYAHQRGGLAAAFLREGRRSAGSVVLALGAMALAFGLAAWWHGLVGLVVASAATGAAVAVVWLAWRRLGGFTGDVLGAAGVVGETVGLIAASARW